MIVWYFCAEVYIKLKRGSPPMGRHALNGLSY